MGEQHSPKSRESRGSAAREFVAGVNADNQALLRLGVRRGNTLKDVARTIGQNRRRAYTPFILAFVFTVLAVAIPVIFMMSRPSTPNMSSHSSSTTTKVTSDPPNSSINNGKTAASSSPQESIVRVIGQQWPGGANFAINSFIFWAFYMAVSRFKRRFWPKDSSQDGETGSSKQDSDVA
jgi:hypothetical protein